LLLFGDEDTATPIAEGELMKREIPDSRLYTIPHAGHLAVFEQAGAAHDLIRQFLDQVPNVG
jgi:pimeloyl-ACP methyl ester carboxylesterase